MAVDSKQQHTEKTIKPSQYYTHHVKRMSYVVVGMLIAVNLAMTILLYISGYDWSQMILFIILPAVSFEVFAIMIILKFALEPLEILTRVIARLSQQPTDLVAPPINDSRYVRSGLKDLVQTIYDRVHESSNIEDDLNSGAAVSAHVVSAFVDRMPCGIVGMSENGQIVFNNAKAPLAKDVSGRSQLQLVFPEDDTFSDWLAQASTRTVKSEKTWRNVATIPMTTGEERVYDVVAVYQKSMDEKNDSVEVIVLMIDQTENYIEDQTAVDFISVAAHELRGPITVIRGYLDVLADEINPQVDKEQQELIDRLDVSASRLSNYINNILNVAKYDRKHLKLHLREERFSYLYGTIADDLNLRARTQNRMLSVNIPNDLPTVAADKDSLSEVISNLVDNAIKYSPEGGVITVNAVVDGDFVRCSVQDKGIGIPSSVANNLFKKFYRSHRSKSSVAGTGLGLFISRVIIESHGGHIGFVSKENEGSTFYFSIPIFSTVADKLVGNGNENEAIIKSKSGWIRNHNRVGG